MSNPRNTIRFMLLFLMALVVAPFFVSGPDGKFIMTWDKFKQRFFTSLPEMPTAVTKIIPDNKQTVYRWKDTRGVWHFTHETPPKQAREISVVDNHVNIIPSAKPATLPNQASDQTAEKNPSLPYSLDGVKQVLEDARKARESGNQHNQNLERAVNNM